MSRHRGDRVHEYGDDHVYLAQVDWGALAPGMAPLVRDGAVSMLAGEPLLPGRHGTALDLAALHDSSPDGWRELLRKARGTFCTAVYRFGGAEASLRLATDKLGVRPMYYCADDDWVVFATALRVLEGVPLVRRRMDVRAVSEIVALGYPLGRRTAYEGVSMLAGGEQVSVVGSRPPERETYWRWEDEIVPSARRVDALAAEAYARFDEAVALRLRGDRGTAAFLSGGLDSRAVVSALRAQGAQVLTFNFSPPRSQDAVLGAEFARQVGSVHTEVPRPEDDPDPDWSAMMGASLRDALGLVARERSAVAWSGDGGSVGVGHVYITPKILAALHTGDDAAVARVFLSAQCASLPRRAMQPAEASRLADVLERGVREELASIGGPDPVRRFHLFLMRNDQRRHLTRHFEDLDLHRVEFQLPFFDAEFLATVMSVPGDASLYHRFYLEWLRHFPAVTTAVPWQAYPGHARCPLPLPERLGYQWSEGARNGGRRGRAHRRLQKKRALAALRSPHFPDWLLDRRVVRAAAWAHFLGVRDCGHILGATETYTKYAARSGGDYSLAV